SVCKEWRLSNGCYLHFTAARYLEENWGAESHEQSNFDFRADRGFDAILAASGLAVAEHGYPHGAIGLKRLDAIANSATFIPLAALYAFSVALLMIMPLKAASFIL